MSNTSYTIYDIPVLLHTKKIKNLLTKYANKNNIDIIGHIAIIKDFVYMDINDDVFDDFADWFKQNHIKDYILLLKKNEIYDNDLVIMNADLVDTRSLSYPIYYIYDEYNKIKEKQLKQVKLIIEK